VQVALTTPYPAEAEARVRVRKRFVDVAVERARRQHTGYSIKCDVATNTGVPPAEHTCKNDGRTCICACHDGEIAG
jgi:hypothetical protein